MTILETLIQFRRHWRAIDMLLEREINQMQEEKLKETLRADGGCHEPLCMDPRHNHAQDYFKRT